MELITRNFQTVPHYVTNTFLFVTSQIFTVVVQIFSGFIFDAFDSAGMIMFTIFIYFYLITLFFIKDFDKDPSEK